MIGGLSNEPGEECWSTAKGRKGQRPFPRSGACTARSACHAAGGSCERSCGERRDGDFGWRGLWRQEWGRGWRIAWRRDGGRPNRGWRLCGGVLPAADERGPRSDRGSTVQGYIHAGDTRFTSPMECDLFVLSPLTNTGKIGIFVFSREMSRANYWNCAASGRSAGRI